MPNVPVLEQIELAEFAQPVDDGRDGIKTPVAVPSTAPVGRIEQANRLEHTTNFVDATTPTSKAKPAGVRGCQVWLKIGTAERGPTSPKSGTFSPKSGLSQAGPHCQRTAILRDRHAHALRRSVRPSRRRQNRLLLAPLGKHQRRNRTVVGSGLGNDYGVDRPVESSVTTGLAVLGRARLT